MEFVDVDDTVIDVNTASEQGAGFDCQGSRGLNALSATTTRIRSGTSVSVRGDSTYYSSTVAKAAHSDGAHVSITVRAVPFTPFTSIKARHATGRWRRSRRSM